MNRSLSKFIFFWCFLIIGLITSQIAGYSEAMTLPELVKTLHATLEWDPAGNLGSITRGELWVNFKLGSPYLLLGNEQLIHSDPVLMQKNGTISFTAEAVSHLTAYFATSPVTQTSPVPETSLTAQTDEASEAATSSADSDSSNRVTNSASSEFTLMSPKISYILIDAGHGGKDPGAIGKYTAAKEVHSLKEKDLVLQVSQKLRDLLAKKYPAKQIILTRETDNYLSLEERIEKANNIKIGKEEAIIFISVHANASFSSAGKGFEVWYLPPQYKRNLIDKEDVEAQNRDIIPILNTMLDAEFTTESILLAKYILSGIDEKVGRLSPNRGLKAEKWFVVHKSKMPSVLIELGFVTNPEEATRLATDTYLQALALGIYNGVNIFVRNFENSKPFRE